MRNPTLFLVIVVGISWQALFAQGSAPAPTIRLDYFPALPRAIDGCGGTYTYDSVSLKQEKFIFVDNLQEKAFIRIGGKEIALKRQSHAVLGGGKTYKDVYTGSGYTVTSIVKDIKETGDEVTYEEGTLEVRKGQFVLKLKIHGESGC
jgi:hypothetical protein